MRDEEGRGALKAWLVRHHVLPSITDDCFRDRLKEVSCGVEIGSLR